MTSPLTNTRPAEGADDDPLVIAGRSFRSRLLVGTGKYQTIEVGREAIRRSGADIVTGVRLEHHVVQALRHGERHASQGKRVVPLVAVVEAHLE